jgi:hypothetical protein
LIRSGPKRSGRRARRWSASASDVRAQRWRPPSRCLERS